jgi:nitroreductase
MPDPKFLPLDHPQFPEPQMENRAEAFYHLMHQRRTVRNFSDRPVPESLIATCIQTAGTAPSGANKQPYHFVAISDPAIKTQIREAAESEEREFYMNRAPQRWLDDIAPFGTDANKPFLEIAPWLIAVFAQPISESDDGKRVQNYYVTESVGITTGLLITSLHYAGLASLTHTPSPMKFLNEILDRPDTERPFLLLVVGYPAPDAQVPTQIT